jgi:Uma2 family endonuclease
MELSGMSTAVQIRPQPATTCPPLYRFTVEQYEKMVESGVLRSGERAELIEGVVVQKMPQDPPHAVVIEYTLDAVRPHLPTGWRLREQKPIRLGDSEPEPDIAVVRGPASRYEKRHPRPTDIAAAIEVADSSVQYDRAEKGRMYARAGIPIYWIINLVDRHVEMYSDPRNGKAPAYRCRKDYGQDDHVPLVIAGRMVGHVAVRDLLPSRAAR